uniref:SP-RING-type domain-containing protein n=1 Tax=Strongyloides papillosus TaxID=174720 RepID=A0A0N5BEM5_STREA
MDNNLSGLSSELSTFRNIVSEKFEIDDFLFCFEKLWNTSTEVKNNLRGELLKVLFNFNSNNHAEKVIFQRGASRGYFPSRVQMHVGKNFSLQSDAPPQIERLDAKTRDIRMRKLYFHRNIERICRWKCVKSYNATRPIYINFELPGNFYQYLRKFDAEGPPQDCIILRCTRYTNYKGDEESLKECYPISMKMFIDKSEYTHLLPREIFNSNLIRKERISAPTVINDALLDFPEFMRDNASVKIKLQFDRMKNEKQEFAFGIFKTTKVTTNDICNEVVRRNRTDLITFNEHLKKFMTSSDGIFLNSVRIVLCSSITFERIKIPFRGRNCHHIYPDDLENYIRINARSEAWLCKICKKPCTPDDIMIDEFYIKILERHPDINEIELYSDMTYELPEENRIYKIEIPDICKNNITEDRGTTGVKIDENIQCNKANFFPRGNDSIQISNVIGCITINDESDQESQPKRRHL